MEKTFYFNDETTISSGILGCEQENGYTIKTLAIDIDGTCTTVQKGRSFYKVPLRQDVIDKVKKLESEGYEIIMWSGNTKYAQDVAKKIGLKTTICTRKPDLIIDNEVRRFGKRLKKRIISPEDFLARDFSKE